MITKITSAVIAALAVLAFAAGPAAAAENMLYSGTTPVALGTSIVGTSVGPVRFTDVNGNQVYSCYNNELKGTVAKNSSSTAEINLSSAVFTGGNLEGRCQTPNGFAPKSIVLGTPGCLRHSSTMGPEWQLRKLRCSESAAWNTLTVDLGSIVCTYTGATSQIGFASSYNTEPLQLATANNTFKLTSGAFPCYETLVFAAEFTLKTAAGANLKFVS